MSCNTKSWVNSSLEEAVDMLSKRAAVARVLRRKLEAQTKSADYGEALNSGLSFLQKQIQENPGAAATLGGAALGAGVGGLSSLATSKERRNVGRSMLTGGLGGAAAGAGGYALSQFIPQIEKSIKPNPADLKFDVPGAGSRVIDKNLIGKNPAVASEIEGLKDKSWATNAVNYTSDAVKGYASNHPVLSAMMGLDAANHVVGTVGAKLSKMPGKHPEVLQSGIDYAIKNDMFKNDDLAKKVVTHLNNQKGVGTTLSGLLEEARNNGPDWVRQIQLNNDTNKPEYGNVSNKLLNELYNYGTPGNGIRSGLDAVEGMGNIRDGVTKNLGELRKDAPGYLDAIKKLFRPTSTSARPAPAAPTQSTPSWLSKALKSVTDKAKSVGNGLTDNRVTRAMAGPAKVLKERGGELADMTGANLKNGIGWAEKRVPKARTLAGHLAPRAALYAGVPLLQSYLQTATQESANSQRLQDIIKQLSKPADQ